MMNGLSKIDDSDFMIIKMSLSDSACYSYFSSPYNVEFIRFIQVEFEDILILPIIKPEAINLNGKQYGMLCHSANDEQYPYFVFVYGIGSRFLSANCVKKFNDNTRIIFCAGDNEFRIEQND